MKYFTFGMKVLRITQNYNQGNHIPHWKDSKDYSDYPIDVAGEDGGKSSYYATVDMQVVAIKGKGNSMTNTIWLVATENCITPLGDNIKPFIMLTHWNDDDPYIAKLKEGEIIKAGTIICLEGTDGQATGNHLHMVCGDANRGCGNNLIKNSNGKWVSTGYCYRPEQIMYVDLSFTEVYNSDGVDFRYIESQVISKGDKGDNIVKIDDFLANQVKGDYYGDYTEACISVYKRKKGIKNTDGSFIDKETLEKMIDDGLEL